MATQYSPKLKLALPVQGELSGTWGDVVNENITSMVEEAIAGIASITTWTANAHTLTTADGTTSEARSAMLQLEDGAGLTTTGTVICPTVSKIYIIKNNTSYSIALKTVAGTGIAVPSGSTMMLYCDGTDVVEALTRVTGDFTVGGTLNVTGSATFSSTVVGAFNGTLGATTPAALSATTGSFSSTLGVTGAATLSSTLGVTGAATLSATLGVTGAVTLSSTLDVSGAITAPNFDGVLGANSPAALSATTGTFSSTLDVTGATTLATLSATIATFSGDMGIGTSSPQNTGTAYGDLTINGTSGGFLNFAKSDVLKGRVGTIDDELRIQTNVAAGVITFRTSTGGVGTEALHLSATRVATFGAEVAVDGAVSFATVSNGNSLFVGNVATTGNGITIGSSTTGDIAFADGITGAAGYAGLVRYDHSSDAMSFWTNSASRVTIDSSGNLLAGTDNTQTNGGVSNRWSVFYAGTDAINTSDAREKTPVASLTDGEIEASKQLGKEIGTYQWLASIEAKGDQARQHIGMTVQRAIEIMESCNLDPMAYGFICYDEWDDVFVEHPAIEAVEANETGPAVEAVAGWTEQTKWAGDRYGFRSGQLNSFIAAGFNARLEVMERNSA